MFLSLSAGFNSILRIQKVRTELTVLTSSNMAWLDSCLGNQTFYGDCEDFDTTQTQRLLHEESASVDVDTDATEGGQSY
jgi:hypothetical protein